MQMWLVKKGLQSAAGSHHEAVCTLTRFLHIRDVDAVVPGNSDLCGVTHL